MGILQWLRRSLGGHRASPPPVAQPARPEQPDAEQHEAPAPAVSPDPADPVEADAPEEFAEVEPNEAGLPAALRPASRLHQPAWKGRFESTCARLSEHAYDLVWIGDSCVQQFERAGRKDFLNYAPIWNRYYKPRNAINLGFAGDDTSNLLWRLENGHLAYPSAKAVVLLIGTNNVNRPKFTPEDTASAIARIAGMMADRLPDAEIIVLSMWPNGRGAETNLLQMDVNTRLAPKLQQMARVRFVDVSGIFMKDGEVDLSKFRDPLQTPPQMAIHPSAAAQAEIAERLEPIMEEIFGTLAD